MVQSVATYGCEGWTTKKSEESRIEAFETKGLRQVLRVSRTTGKPKMMAKAGVRKKTLRYFGHITRHNCLQRKTPFKEINQETGRDEDQRQHA